MVFFAAALLIALLFLVGPISRGLVWTGAAAIAIAALILLAFHSRQLARAREQSAPMLNALGSTTVDLPVSLRTRMPLVMIVGDALAQLFDGRDGAKRLAHVGDGAIWLRVDRPRDLPGLAMAVKQWRGGRAPDAVVLSIAPALHAGEDALAQMLRLARQALGDASRMLGTRLPGYVAVYQRLSAAQRTQVAPQWYGVSSAIQLAGTQRFESPIRVAEEQVQQAHGDPVPAARAASLASIIDWTQRVVVGALTDQRQPAAPWRLFGIGWIECGPASVAGTPWARDVQAQTGILPPAMPAFPAPWPLPQPLIEALPQRPWGSPRTAAVAHAIALLAFALALAIWSSAKNNQAMLTRIGADIGRYSMISQTHDSARRDALQTLVTERDLIDRYGRVGVPLRLSFGMYRAAALTETRNVLGS